MNIGSKQPIASNTSRHAPSWRFHLHCGVKVSNSPGVICIVCPQVLCHPSENGKCSMGKHLLAKAHITQLNELTESEVTELTCSTVDETALAILKSQESRGIRILLLQRKIEFNIQFNPYWPKWQTKRSKLAAKDFEISEFHQDTWNRYLMLGFVLAYIPLNAISNLELWGSHMALRDDLVLPSATTLSNICPREYALTVDAIKKQLPVQNRVCLAFDGWTSTNKLAITSVIAYNMDPIWALHEVPLAFDVVDRLLYSRIESSLSMICQRRTYWSKTSGTLGGPAWSFWAYWRPFAWNYNW